MFWDCFPLFITELILLPAISLFPSGLSVVLRSRCGGEVGRPGFEEVVGPVAPGRKEFTRADSDNWRTLREEQEEEEGAGAEPGTNWRLALSRRDGMINTNIYLVLYCFKLVFVLKTKTMHTTRTLWFILVKPIKTGCSVGCISPILRPEGDVHTLYLMFFKTNKCLVSCWNSCLQGEMHYGSRISDNRLQPVWGEWHWRTVQHLWWWKHQGHRLRLHPYYYVAAVAEG